MKLRFFSLVLVGLMATITFAATIDQLQQTDGNSGNWNNPAMWKTQTRLYFPSTYTTGDEWKLNTTNSTLTIDDTRTYNNRVTVAAGDGGQYSDGNSQKLVVATGANAKFSEVRVGHGNSSGAGNWGRMEQTGGTLSVKDLQVGYYGTRVFMGVNSVKGTYTISGGTLQMNGGTTGRIMVGCGSTIAGGTIANNEGVFTVSGNGATISMADLYVAGDAAATAVGKGTLAFEVAAAGVSKIVVSTGITLDSGAALSSTNLNVRKLGNYLGDIVLVENTGGSAVLGLFDSVNGGSGLEGAIVNVSGDSYTLTYLYDASTGNHTGGNDIALIPEPATIALLGLGLIAIRRKK